MSKIKRQKGLTLIELMITICIAAVVTFGVAIMLADNLRNWGIMYNRLHSQAADDSYAVRRLFDKVIRQASSGSHVGMVGIVSNEVSVIYYDWTIPLAPIECTADFKFDSTTQTLTAECKRGTTTLSRQAIPNVLNCSFKLSGRAVQMLLTLDNKDKVSGRFSEKLYVYSTAYLNEY